MKPKPQRLPCSAVRRTGDFSFYLPLLPKPPLPRSVSESSVASTRPVLYSIPGRGPADRMSYGWQLPFMFRYKRNIKNNTRGYFSLSRGRCYCPNLPLGEGGPPRQRWWMRDQTLPLMDERPSSVTAFAGESFWEKVLHRTVDCRANTG